MGKKNLDKQLYTVSAKIPLTHDAADKLFVKLLRYWDDLLAPPKDGEWEHPEDTAINIERRKAIKVLLDYIGEA